MAGNEGDRDLIDLSRTGQVVAPPDDAEVERAIASVPGVTSATLRRDPDSGRTRLRLRLRAGEDAEQAAWSIAATLRERFGIALDPASIRPVAASETSESEVSDADDGADEGPADPVRAEVASAVPASMGDADAAGTTSEHDVSAAAPPPGPPTLVLSPPPPPQQTAVADHGEGANDDPGCEPGTEPGAEPAPEPAPEAATEPAPEPATAHGPTRESAATARALRVGDRATIHRLDIERGAQEVQATVALLRGDQAAQGVARAVPTTRSILRAIAEATASALQQFMTAPLLIGIDRIDVEPAADPAHVLVAVTILADRGEEQLLGVSLVRGDAERAVVRATLDALNRRVSPFLAGAPEREAAAAS